MASPTPSSAESCRRGRNLARASVSGFYTLAPPTLDLFNESSRLSRLGTASLLSRSSPAGSSTGTPPMPHVHECTTYNYAGVPYSSPKRPRATSMHPPARSPALLPIGVGRGAHMQHKRSTSTAEASTARFGLGLTLERLATAPSLQPEAAPREERARRRHAIDFHTHMHYSEVLELNTGRDIDIVKKLERGTRSTHRERSREHSGSDTQQVDSPGKVSVGCEKDADVVEMNQELEMKDITSAFPSPPLSTPALSPSMISRVSLTHPHLPPPIPLPPTPPALQPSYFQPEEYDSPSSGATVIDQSESMAMLERSIAKLEEAFSPRRSIWSGISAPDDDEISIYSGSSAEASTEESSDQNSPLGNQQDPSDESSPLDNPTQLDPIPPREARSEQAILTMLSVLSVSEVNLPMIRLSHASTVSKLPSPGDAQEGRKAEEQRHRSSILFLPKFEFEHPETTELKPKDLPFRSASLIDIPSHLQPPSASTPARDRPRAGHKGGSSDIFIRPRADKRPSTSSGAPSRETAFRPRFQADSPLRHPKTTPFLFRPLRRIDPMPDTPPRNIPLKRTESRVGADAPASILTPPTTPSRQTDEDAPPSFIHLTPEQQQSRMSKLWTKARTGMGTGLKREKSNRWLRGGFMQAKGVCS